MLLWKFYLINPHLTLLFSPFSLQNAWNNQSVLSADMTASQTKVSHSIRFDNIFNESFTSKALLRIVYCWRFNLSNMSIKVFSSLFQQKWILLRIAFALNAKHIFGLKSVWFCVSHHWSLLLNAPANVGPRKTKTEIPLEHPKSKTETECKSWAQCKRSGQISETIEFDADFGIDLITKCILMSFEEIHYCKIIFTINWSRAFVFRNYFLLFAFVTDYINESDVHIRIKYARKLIAGHWTLNTLNHNRTFRQQDLRKCILFISSKEFIAIETNAASKIINWLVPCWFAIIHAVHGMILWYGWLNIRPSTLIEIARQWICTFFFFSHSRCVLSPGARCPASISFSSAINQTNRNSSFCR